MKFKSLIIAAAVAASASAYAGHHMSGEGSKAKHDTAHQAQTQSTIVDVASGNSDFSTLVAALSAADLVEVLQGDGPFTVFAPTDEAFAALPDGTVDMLLKPENKDKLVTVLTYHVVPGKVLAKDVIKLSSATTVQGEDIAISTHDGKVMINNAHVVSADIEASNGVIHVIDAVIMPNS